MYKWTVHFWKLPNLSLFFKNASDFVCTELCMNNLLPEPFANVFGNKFIEKRLLYRINIIYVKPTLDRRKYDFGNSIVSNLNSFWDRNSDFVDKFIYEFAIQWYFSTKKRRILWIPYLGVKSQNKSEQAESDDCSVRYFVTMWLFPF